LGDSNARTLAKLIIDVGFQRDDPKTATPSAEHLRASSDLALAGLQTDPERPAANWSMARGPEEFITTRCRSIIGSEELLIGVHSDSEPL
jgi:hypothetical protein